jgi:hypothetical protein
MHRGVASIAMTALALSASAIGCGSKSSGAKLAKPTASSTSTTRSSGSSNTTTFSIPKATFPVGEDPCKLPESEVSSTVGFAVHKVPPPNDRSCDYSEGTQDGARDVYILWNRGTETRAKADSVFSLGGRSPAEVTELTGFPGWAFTASQELHDTIDFGVALSGDHYFNVRINAQNRDETLPAKAKALAHKLVA